MELSLGSFGDLRLDKGGVRFSNGLCRARRFACADWAVTARASCRPDGSLPTPKPAPAQAGGDGGKDRRRMERADRRRLRGAACAGDSGHHGG
jgi:hypothetical protein